MLDSISKYSDLLKEYTFIDLFAGIGGFRVTLESLGATCVFSSEIDKYAAQTYELNYNDKPYGDITKIDAEDIPNFDILCAGFPCQAFSISGKQLGFEDSRGTLLFDVLRIVDTKKPKVVFLENVKNFSRHNNGITLSFLKEKLIEEGYHFYNEVLNAKDFGLPQKRERTIMVAIRKDIDKSDQFVFPYKLSNNGKILKDIVEKEIPDYAKIPVSKLKNLVLNDNNQNKVDYNMPVRLGTINKGGQGDRIYSPNGLSITISASSGGTGSKTGLYLINDEIRKLTLRECARIQGFPEDFKFIQSVPQMYKMFGNSIPVNMLQAVALNFALLLEG